MICLAAHTDPDPLSVTENAKCANVPRAFLEQILSNLKRSNLLISGHGKQGGFLLARKSTEISFADVIRPIDGPLALAPCASRTAYMPCPECKDVGDGGAIVGVSNGTRRHGDIRRLKLEVGLARHRCEIDVPADSDLSKRSRVAVKLTNWLIFPVRT